MSKEYTIAVIHPSAPSIIEGVRGIVPPAVRLLDAGKPEAMPRLEEIDAAITQNWQPNAESAPRLRWLHLISAGYDHVSQEVLHSKRWVVTHGGGASAVPMAEWCLAMMLHFAHRMPKILDYQARRSWYANRAMDMSGKVLRGATVGFIGYGAMGRELARMCDAMGMRVLASIGRRGRQQAFTYRTQGTGDPEGNVPQEWFEMDRLHDAVQRMDYIVLGLRSDPESRHIVNADFLRQVKPEAVLINPSRGSLVDESALIEALKQRKLSGAALDVFDIEPLPAGHPLRDAPNIVLSPHCSPESEFYRQEMRDLIAENIRRFVAGERLMNVIGSVVERAK